LIFYINTGTKYLRRKIGCRICGENAISLVPDLLDVLSYGFVLEK
jgi:hypothetical protein